jgi:hypothetical protein
MRNVANEPRAQLNHARSMQKRLESTASASARALDHRSTQGLDAG